MILLISNIICDNSLASLKAWQLSCHFIVYIEDENSTMEFGIVRNDEYGDWEFEPNTIPKRYEGIVFDCLLDIESFMEDIDEIAEEYL